MNTIQELIAEIKRLEKKLGIEIQKREDEFFYRIKGKKVFFEEATRRYHKSLATRLHTYLLHARFLNILTVPIIWFCLLPALFLDGVVSFYQFVCFPVYRIPRVRRADYVVIDRYALRYLNLIEKINCVYCGYFNGLIAYVQEIAARTEQYWCPIKHARKVAHIHSRYARFLEYGDGREYKNKIEEIRHGFHDLD